VSPLVLSLIDGLLHAAMIGTAESYLGAFAVELGHRDMALGLLATLPIASGALSQLAAPALSRWLGRRSRLVVAGAALQALSLVAMIAIARTGSTSLAALLTVKLLFWVSGAAIAPAWSEWMAVLTEEVDRQRYFAWRSAATQVALLLAFLAAGEALHGARALGQTLEVYGMLFGVAAMLRAASAVALLAQARARRIEPPPEANPDIARSPLRLAISTSQWRTALYVGALMFGAQISVPFFTPYMLRELQLDYRSFATLTAVSIVCKVLVFPLCHPLASRIGLRPVLIASGVGIATVPPVWALVDTPAGIAFAQGLGGVVWAGFEYASFQLLLSSAQPACRLEFLSLAGSLSGLLQVAGALLGSQLIERLGLGYRDIFWLSGAGRALALSLLLSALPNLPWPSQLRRPMMRLWSVRPNAGAVLRAIFGRRRP